MTFSGGSFGPAAQVTAEARGTQEKHQGMHEGIHEGIHEGGDERIPEVSNEGMHMCALMNETDGINTSCIFLRITSRAAFREAL